MSEIAELLADLRDAFPRQDVTLRTMRVYARELRDLPIGTLEEAVRTLMRTSEFFPTIKSIREQASEALLRLPNESEALAQIEARIVWARPREDGEMPQGEPPAVHPLVKEALDHVGGFHAFKSADEPGVIRGQFARLYRETRTAAVRAVQSGDSQRAIAS